jgi:hypothetical protein
MTAIMNPNANGAKILDIELWLVPRLINKAIKNENRCSDGASWGHWNLDQTKNSTLTGPVGSQYEGIKIVLGLAGDTPEGMYGVHYGYGASQKNNFYGMSSWLRYTQIEYPTSGPGAAFFQNKRFNDRDQYNHGDLNLNLECACGCPCPSGNCTKPPVVSVCGNGIVEAGEQCDPGDGSDQDFCCRSNCTFASAGTVCRPASDGCDKEDTCSGTNAVCPDALQPAQTPCDAEVGYCDVYETSVCNGKDKHCPSGPTFFDTNNGPARARFVVVQLIIMGKLFAIYSFSNSSWLRVC